MQGWYIGITAASQAVKAGSTPVPCSKKKDTPGGVSFFLEQHFCSAKVVPCGRVTEREWGNPSKVPPSHSPFLAMCGSATAKPVGSHKKKHHPDRMVFLFGMSRAGWNSLPRPARSASNPEVKAGFLRMALPFVGCREASSSLVYFAAQSAKTKETPSGQDGVSFLTVPGETPVSGRAAPPAPRRSAPAGRPGRR